MTFFLVTIGKPGSAAGVSTPFSILDSLDDYKLLKAVFSLDISHAKTIEEQRRAIKALEDTELAVAGRVRKVQLAPLRGIFIYRSQLVEDMMPDSAVQVLESLHV